jgi:gamma-glutamyltranspeptidase/glutathione hydrolase
MGTSTKWSGMAALQMLNIIEGYDFSDIPFGSAKHLHIVNEAKKLVLKTGLSIADMNFVKVPVQQLFQRNMAIKEEH